MWNAQFVSKHCPSFQSDNLKGTPASRRPDDDPSIIKWAAEKWLPYDHRGSGYVKRTATLSTATSFSSPPQAGSQLTTLPTVTVCLLCSVGFDSSYTWFWHVSRDVPVNQAFNAISVLLGNTMKRNTLYLCSIKIFISERNLKMFAIDKSRKLNCPTSLNIADKQRKEQRTWRYRTA